MKKLNITKGEWTSKDLHITSKDGKRIGNTLLMSFEDDGRGRIIKDTEGESNAEAIVTAVNNTYGKGINPESVPTLLATLEEILKDAQHISIDKETEEEDYNILKGIIGMAKIAIEKATK